MDIPNGHLFRLDTISGEVAHILEGPVLGASVLRRDGSLLLLGIHGEIWRWQGEQHTRVAAVQSIRGTRFNDAIADSTGRVLSGTIPTANQSSTLYMVARDGSHRVLATCIGQSNGMALSDDERTLYHADTRAAVVRAYPYDVERGAIGSPQRVAAFAERDGVPDGMAMDEEGCLWIAMWGGGAVVRLAPSGERVATLRVPTPLVSSVAFGGPELADLYITTAGGDNRTSNGRYAGGLFVARPGVRGAPAHRSAL